MKAKHRNANSLRALAKEAHDCLHQENVEGAHGVLHDMIDKNVNLERLDIGGPTKSKESFDEKFRELCMSHNIQAAYLIAEDAPQIKVPGDNGFIMGCGGVGWLSKWLDRLMLAEQAGQHADKAKKAGLKVVK